MADILYITIPCYNEEEVLPETARQLGETLRELKEQRQISEESKVFLVDDGSGDSTWAIIQSLCTAQPKDFAGLKLSRNQGHQNALLAGLMSAKEQADVTISMDADLQDDIGVLWDFLEQYREGYDIVYGVRSDRQSDTAFKRATAQGFYKFMKFLGVDIVYNHADCRLMSRRALEGLAQFTEVNLFLRGIVPLIGYRSTTVEYKRNPRFAGESKYPFRKMVAFAWDGITSFSVRPIRFITVLGFSIFLVSLGLILYSLIQKWVGSTVPGWSSLMVSLWLLGGLIILSLGVVGEYIGKIYQETKDRPKYLIETLLDENHRSAEEESTF